MTARDASATRGSASVLDAGRAALRKVIAGSLKRPKPQGENSDTVFNAFTDQDPVNQVLEGEIIPRLMMAHAIGASSGPFEASGPFEGSEEIDMQDIQRFADLPLKLEASSLLEEVERFLEQGASIEDVYLDLLAPAARHLGDMWSNDECDFIEVTMGLWRLQEVMRELSLRSPPQMAGLAHQRRALFSPLPGDDHSFGAQMIEEVFARAGWQSEAVPCPERRDLLDRIAKNHFNVVGLSVSHIDSIATVSSLIKAIRSVSANPGVCVLVGGHVINENPGIITEIGADGTGVDAREALKTAEKLVSRAPASVEVMT